MPFSTLTRQVRQATVHLMVCDLNNANERFVNLRSSGTGFFVSDDGWLLTCNHVISGFRPGQDKIVAVFKVNDTNVTFAEATAIAHSFPEIDMCAIQFETFPDGAGFIEVSETAPEAGDNLGIFGYPDTWFMYDEQGQIQTGFIKPRVANCVVARIEPMNFLGIRQRRLIETQFSFVKGNSGGPAFSAESGEVVGIVMGNQHFHQTAHDYAVVYKSADQAITGEVLYPPPAPIDLSPGFSWRRITSVAAVTYSYAVPCDEMRACLAGFLPNL
jgi:hypothetical protein